MNTNIKANQGLQAAIQTARRLVTQSGRVNVYRYICKTREGLEIMDDFEYQSFGNEDRCRAVVWSFEDGEYNSANVFIPNGKIASSVETY